jgi:hypothetical protein
MIIPPNKSVNFAKKKKIIMVTLFAGSYGMAMSFFSHPLAASSSPWTVRGLS